MNRNSVSISGSVHRRVLPQVKRYLVRVRNTMTVHNERPCRRRKALSLNRNTFTVSSYSAEVQINRMYVIYSSRGSGCFRNHILHTVCTTYWIPKEWSVCLSFTLQDTGRLPRMRFTHAFHDSKIRIGNCCPLVAILATPPASLDKVDQSAISMNGEIAVISLSVFTRT